jgi:hypothetical protein
LRANLAESLPNAFNFYTNGQNSGWAVIVAYYVGSESIAIEAPAVRKISPRSRNLEARMACGLFDRGAAEAVGFSQQ